MQHTPDRRIGLSLCVFGCLQDNLVPAWVHVTCGALCQCVCMYCSEKETKEETETGLIVTYMLA